MEVRLYLECAMRFSCWLQHANRSLRFLAPHQSRRAFGRFEPVYLGAYEVAESAGAGRMGRVLWRLVKVEGVGPLVATAVVAAIGNTRQFTNGRELSAWLGLVPREHSSGQRTMLLGINKRGNRYLRTLLIHGARVAERKRDARSIWLSRLKLRGGPNVAAVALANKNARVMWALLARGDSYRVRPAMDRAAAA